MTRARGVVAVAVMALALLACVGDPASLLEQHGWPEHEWLAQERVLIGILDTRDWRNYLEASREIGLDFEPWWGREAHVVTYDVGPATGYVLLGDGTPIGGWLVDDGGRVRPLDTDEVTRPAG